jgi:hypothetical protein
MLVIKEPIRSKKDLAKWLKKNVPEAAKMSMTKSDNDLVKHYENKDGGFLLSRVCGKEK